MNFWSKMINLDRRIIYLMLAIVVILPVFFPIGLKLKVSPETQKLYDEIDKLAITQKPLLLSCDYDPATLPELEPMTLSIIRHCFSKNIPVILTTIFITGPGIVERAMKKIQEEYPNKVYGKDYVFLGYKPGAELVIMGIGQNFKKTYPMDNKRISTSELEITKNINNYNDLGLVISISGTGIVESWMTYANARYGAKVGIGVTAVMASDYFPYIQTGQFVGMLGGVKGAAEYETLINKHGEALKIMESQNFAHLLIILFIAIGNIAFFMTKNKDKSTN